MFLKTLCSVMTYLFNKLLLDARLIRALSHMVFGLIAQFPIVLSAQVVNTVAGVQGQVGALNATAHAATFNNPHGVEIDRQGNIYVADRYNHLIRKIDTDGNVSTLAGSGVVGSVDGQGTAASFREPWGLTVDSLGTVYVADTKNNKIRKISPSGLVSTLAGTGTFGLTDASNPLAASFGNPTGIAIDKKGNIYVGDHLTHLIRKISPSGAVTTLAGNKNYPNNAGFVDGIGQAAQFQRPYGVEVDLQGNVYVADEWNHAVRKVSALGVVTTLAGNGTIGNTNATGASARFNYPWDVAIDSLGIVYVADGYNYVIRKIDKSGVVSTFAGIGASGASDGPALMASFNGATSVSINKSNTSLTIGDAYNQLIRRITLPKPIAKPIISFDAPNAGKDSMSVCAKDKAVVNISADYDSYDFYLDGIKVMSTFDKTYSFENLPAGAHKVEVMGIQEGYIGGASNILTIFTKPSTAFTLKANKTTGLCMGDSVEISTSDSSSVTWNTGAVGNKITVRNTWIYYATAADPKYCFAANDSVKLVFNPLPIITVVQEGPSPLYKGDTLVLTASGAMTYLWSSGVIDKKDTITKSGVYAVKGTSKEGCSTISDSIKVVFLDRPTLLKVIHTSGLRFCAGDSLMLRANVGKNITWIHEGLPMNRSDSVLYVKSPGHYTFIYQKDPQNTEYADTVLVGQIENPLVAFSADPIELNKNNKTVSFTSETDISYQYHWDFGELDMLSDTSAEINPQYIYNRPGLYSVTLEVKTQEGCRASIKKGDYIIFEGDIFVATGFTPNGDGINDEVRIRGVLPEGRIKFSIYNEWGEQVFNSTSVDRAWDGTYKGQVANAGNYSYILDTDIQGVQQTRKGIITLIK